MSAADAARVGGKAAALGELARVGLPVPAGFVITTAAFSLHMDAVDPD
ncbi:MAG TPA: PEP/pyruvate-binding domain-containing protein, partial [Streptosporangiaceae bacterium]|nr:PEP/pyruvate-binding domain-containing protein [Streptosporangiaceae bacterium]